MYNKTIIRFGFCDNNNNNNIYLYQKEKITVIDKIWNM